tara:strand:- start:691 stop:864 length:174 start_codon:yes stop_codon:yes gene_type:complete
MNDFRVTVITEIVTDHEVQALSWEMAQELAKAEALVKVIKSRLQCDILSCEAEEEDG